MDWEEWFHQWNQPQTITSRVSMIHNFFAVGKLSGNIQIQEGILIFFLQLVSRLGVNSYHTTGCGENLGPIQLKLFTCLCKHAFTPYNPRGQMPMLSFYSGRHYFFSERLLPEFIKYFLYKGGSGSILIGHERDHEIVLRFVRDFVFEGCRLSSERATGTLFDEDREMAQRLFLVQSEIVDIMERYGFLKLLLDQNICKAEMYQLVLKKVSEKKIYGEKPVSLDHAYQQGSRLAEITILMRSKLDLNHDEASLFKQ